VKQPVSCGFTLLPLQVALIHPLVKRCLRGLASLLHPLVKRCLRGLASLLHPLVKSCLRGLASSRALPGGAAVASPSLQVALRFSCSAVGAGGAGVAPRPGSRRRAMLTSVGLLGVSGRPGLKLLRRIADLTSSHPVGKRGRGRRATLDASQSV